MKEFHLVFAKAENKSQLVQVLKDTHYELNFEGRGILDSMYFFENYYNLSFSMLQLYRLGKFIKSGEYRKQVELYV